MCYTLAEGDCQFASVLRQTASRSHHVWHKGSHQSTPAHKTSPCTTNRTVATVRTVIFLLLGKAPSSSFFDFPISLSSSSSSNRAFLHSLSTFLKVHPRFFPPPCQQEIVTHSRKTTVSCGILLRRTTEIGQLTK